MALACKGHNECALTRTEYGFLMGFFVAIQVGAVLDLLFIFLFSNCMLTADCGTSPSPTCFASFQVVLTFPLIFAAALYDTFVTQRAAPQSSA